MECAKCGEQTVDVPCRACGEDPLLDGRYRLLEPIGRGTSGHTWRARTEASGELVAIKEMLLSKADADKTRELWEREVRILKQLDHPQIPSFVDSFIVGRGRSRSLCLVQELVQGVSLEEEMERRRYTEADVLDILRGLTPVLDYLHGLSPPVIHRDLKPSNVMRRPDGELVLIDFGAVRDALKDTQLGGSTVAGTFGYMAPEQFRGDASAATDYYALGGLAVSLLTRRAPHTLLDHHGVLHWQPHANVGPRTTQLLDSLLQKEPAHRPVGSKALDALLDTTYAEPDTSAAAALFEPQEYPQLPGRPVQASVQLHTPEREGPNVAMITGVAVAALGGLSLLVSFGLIAAALLAQPTEVEPPVVIEVPAQPVPGVPLDTGLNKAHAIPPETPMHFATVWNRRDTPIEVVSGGSTFRIGPNGVLPSGLPEGVHMVGTIDDQPIDLLGGQLLICDETCVPGEWAAIESAPIHRAEPGWPVDEAGTSLVNCDVTVHVLPSGQAFDAMAPSCPAPFATVAEAALRTWRFEPQDAPAEVVVPIQFSPGQALRPVVITQGNGNPLLHIDGREVGRVPWTGQLAPGAHAITLEGARPTLAIVEAGENAQLIRY